MIPSLGTIFLSIKNLKRSERMDIGISLKTARIIDADISRRELYERSGVAESTIADIEEGKDSRLSTINKLCDALGYKIIILRKGA